MITNVSIYYSCRTSPASDVYKKIGSTILVRSVEPRGMAFLILTVKMETKPPVYDHLVVNFRRSVISAELSRPEVTRR